MLWFVLIILSVAISVFIVHHIHKITKENIVPSVPAKDPNDFTLTYNSSEWKTSNTWCPNCLSEVGHGEYMADVCNHCGEHSDIMRYGRSYRKIWNGDRWVVQYKFRSSNPKLEKAIQKAGGLLVYENNWLKYVLIDKPF